jgi:TRAP-type C4-dicarboxylate transport system permease small subunit
VAQRAEPTDVTATPPDVGVIEEFVQRDKETLAALPVFFRVLDLTFKTVMVAMLAVLVVSVGTNVFGRFILDNSLAVSDQLARFLFVWVIFLGAALAHLHREHIEVDFLVQRVPPAARRALVVVQELLILVLVVALLLGAREVLATSPGDMPLLGVPYNWMNFSVPVSAVVIGLVSLYRLAVVLLPTRPDSSQEA